jgi:putative flippase GtrA
MMIKRELSIFLVVGLLAMAIDFAVYRALIFIRLLDLNGVSFPKGVGFIVGTIFAYFANRFWTFNRQTIGAGSVGRFILVYLLGLTANIAVNYLSISWLATLAPISGHVLIIGFLLATGVSAVLNFIGMKFFVFTDSTHAT